MNKKFKTEYYELFLLIFRNLYIKDIIEYLLHL
jgi:hypothetical protein